MGNKTLIFKIMNCRLLISSLIVFCLMSAPLSHAETINLTGAWKGPKDLMINVCDNNQNQQYVCSCGIFRTWGWVNLSTTFSNDSIIIVSEEIDNPFEGRFKIESNDRLEGTLTMGNPGNEWYYNDKCELMKQKPEMPDNLNHALEGTIFPEDYGVSRLTGKWHRRYCRLLHRVQSDMRKRKLSKSC